MKYSVKSWLFYLNKVNSSSNYYILKSFRAPFLISSSRWNLRKASELKRSIILEVSGQYFFKNAIKSSPQLKKYSLVTQNSANGAIYKNKNVGKVLAFDKYSIKAYLTVV